MAHRRRNPSSSAGFLTALLAAAIACAVLLTFWPLRPGDAQPAASVGAVIDASRPRQTMVGFGGDFAPFHVSHLAGDDRRRLLSFLVNEMGVNLIRMDTAYFEGATADNMWGANDDADPFHIAWPAFNFCTRPGDVCNDGWKDLLPELRRLGVDGEYFGNIQGPRWNGFDGRSAFNEDEAVENQLALFLYFRDRLGLSVGWVAPFSEPSGGGINWRISPAQAVAVVAKLGLRLEREGIRGVRMIIPDAVGVGISHGYASAILADPIARRFVGAIGYHTYDTKGGGPAPSAEWIASRTQLRELGRQHGLPVRMTEFCCSAGLLERANHIFNELEYADSQTYFPQFIFSARRGHGGTAGESDQAAIAFHRTSGTSQVTFGPTRDTGVAIGHYSRYAKPGWLRLPVRSTDPAVRIQAFLAPSRAAAAVVIINNRGSGMPVTVSFTDGLSVERIVRSETSRAGAASYWEALRSASSGPEGLTAAVPASSVTSLLVQLKK